MYYCFIRYKDESTGEFHTYEYSQGVYEDKYRLLLDVPSAKLESTREDLGILYKEILPPDKVIYKYSGRTYRGSYDEMDERMVELYDSEEALLRDHPTAKKQVDLFDCGWVYNPIFVKG